MEQDKEIPPYIKPEVIGKREINYLILKRKRVISDLETLNHMYGAVRALGSLDIDSRDRYQAIKKKATKIIQKCSELLGSVERGVGLESENSNKIPKERIPKEISKGNNGPSPKNLKTILGSKEKSSKSQKGGFDIRPDSGE